MPDRDNPVANPLIVLREEFDDWAILFDPDTGNAFGLNPTAVYVWKLLNGQNSKDDIVKKLRDAADGVPEDVRNISEISSSPREPGACRIRNGTNAEPRVQIADR